MSFGPFSDSASIGTADALTFSSSYSNEVSSFESFGDFCDFQAATEDGESTPTTSGSWTLTSKGEFGVGVCVHGQKELDREIWLVERVEVRCRLRGWVLPRRYRVQCQL